MGRRIKVSMTLGEDVVAAIDRETRRSAGKSRSSVVEGVLEAWLHEQKRAAMDDAIEEYYLGSTSEELDEDAAWVTSSEDEVDETWGAP